MFSYTSPLKLRQHCSSYSHTMFYYILAHYLENILTLHRILKLLSSKSMSVFFTKTVEMKCPAIALV